MGKRIIHQGPDGIEVTTPAPGCPLTIEQIARKDIPQGVPYLILDEEEMPADFTFLPAWEADFSQPHGHGDPDGYWAELEAAAEAAREAEAEEPEL